MSKTPATLTFNQIDGHELMRPFKTVKGTDQLRLLSKFKALGFEQGEEVNFETVDLDALADFVDYVGENFTIDPVKFDEFTMGEEGFVRALTLATAYAGELGKDKQ